MGRRHQPKPAGGTFLVTNRGTAQTNLYRTDHDRRCFIGLMSQLEPRFGLTVIAYVLMGNHYHLILRSAGDRLADGMQFIDGTYARRFNACHHRRGALFQGRYDARLLDSESGLAGAGHYVHLNPVRAGLVADPVSYPWSSMKAYSVGRSALRWLHLDLLDGACGDDYVANLRTANPDFATTTADRPDDLTVFEQWDDERLAAGRFATSDGTVARLLGASVDEFYVTVRGRTNVPRMIAIVHAQQMTGLPTAVVASRYGLRRRTSVHAVVRRLSDLVAADASLADNLTALGIEL